MDDASLVAQERGSIFEFLEEVAHLFTDRDVLDLGCGGQPYRGLVEAHGGRYTPYDRKEFLPHSTISVDIGPHDPLWGAEEWDVILSTQVIQYVPNVDWWLREIRNALRPNGHLILTGPTNWPEGEIGDLWRFTQAGIRQLLERHFDEVRVLHRTSIHAGEVVLSLGWGAVARRECPPSSLPS